ncbi:hypothetical protein ASPZODRAFT_162598 [Penicilliopsis zonata CBS 506.65]|uniref:Amino acid permease/ SLC12A domain-containing protein n=1 Tax=Penicilliopsis zonata CBS 506.65 TaxID=1073090 RepID=A0A1L9STX1_9EURO|nr:hypothetical protein ASPZODRAFT_162598 [Penicilliopsis zonata CBS 506.65]OJJ50652.1 hypothetical protein ASPZODRAFT_162598 [Penicilliopsis zonata CBS 506.65]
MAVESASDAQLLAAMGYKQELRRQYSTIHIFAITFSIMGLMPSIASALSFSLLVGPAGMVWGWVSATFFIFLVGLSMGDLASALPTAGGLYWWTHHFAAKRFKNPLSFLVGYSNTLGLIGGLCSLDYTLSLMILSCVSIHNDGEWTASRGVIYAVFAAILILHGVGAAFLGRLMPRILTVCLYLNIALVVATVVALPVGKRVVRHEPLNSAGYVFGHVENQTGWPVGWAFFLSWLAPIWSVASFDSCVHMSEEAMHAARAVPLGIVWTAGSAWVLGFLCVAVIAAVMDTNVDHTLSSVFGQPMAQIYYDALGKRGALGFMAAIIFVQFLMGLTVMVATSRQAWAFSRDGALPFSNFFRHISTRVKYQPVRVVMGLVVMGLIVGLLCLINNAAANALFSLFVASNYLSWGLPIFCRLVWGQHEFQPGEFYTGVWSRPIATVAVIYLAFGIVLSMFPTTGPNPSHPAEDMNYTVVINGIVWAGCLIYYALFARRWFTGPKVTATTSLNAEVSKNQTETTFDGEWA